MIHLILTRISAKVSETVQFQNMSHWLQVDTGLSVEHSEGYSELVKAFG